MKCELTDEKLKIKLAKKEGKNRGTSGARLACQLPTLVWRPRTTFGGQTRDTRTKHGTLPSRVTSHRHRVSFSAKQTERKEGQQDISSFFSFSMADISGNQNSEWNQKGFQFAGILLPGCKSRGSGQAFVQKSLPNLCAHAQKSIIRAFLLWHKPHMSFCLLYNHPNHAYRIVLVTSPGMLTRSFPDYRLGWRTEGRDTAMGAPVGGEMGGVPTRKAVEGVELGKPSHLDSQAWPPKRPANQCRKGRTERQTALCD